jgi:hypothetical protein
MWKNGLLSFVPQATLELIASNYHSQQLVIADLTDLFHGAIVFTLKRIQTNNSLAIAVSEIVTLEQAAMYIAHHLQVDCVSIVENPKPAQAVEIMQVFKKARTTTLDD